VGTEEHCEGKKGFFIDTPCTSYSCASWGVPPRTIVITLVKATGSGGTAAVTLSPLFSQTYQGREEHLQRCLDEGKHFNIGAAIKSNAISDGLKYSLATGNQDKERLALVSQVLNRLTYASSLSHLRRNTPWHERERSEASSAA
jgi:DNA-directed RNA polymerase II subunit RPB2